MRWMFLAVSIVFAVALAGCKPAAPKEKPGDDPKKSEEEIKQAFGELQGAIQAKDVDKIWGLLAKDTQGDTERQAKLVKETFCKMADSDKPAYEQKVGLTAKELTEMTGKLYVKSSTFFTGETAEMPRSKWDKVVITGEQANVHYTEDDGKGEKETRSVIRQEGRWKFYLPVPQAVLK